MLEIGQRAFQAAQLATDERNRQMLHQYGSEWGKNWKQQADREFPPDEAVKIWESLREHHVLPPYDQDIVFIGPTANNPTREVAIYNNEIVHRSQGKVSFLVGDIAHIERDLSTVIPDGNPQHTFTYHQWDAGKMSEFVPLGSADIIWENKGLLHLNAQYYRGAPDPATLLKGSLQNYGSILKIGGSIVIDADEPITGPNGRLERSTESQITATFGAGIWDYVKTMFDIQDITAGRHHVRVLTKRASQN